MSKYEISLWEDKYDPYNDRYNEQKSFVIGSDTMTTQARAQNPKLVTNINGTSVLTFDMYYYFIDATTGEEIYNPYVKHLVNERKIKAFWKNKWYDFLIKDIREDSSGRVFSYTCEDTYITELSRTGFNLEFDTDLGNNIGTAPELVEKVLEGTDWRFNPNDTIYQLIEEPVFEATTAVSFSALQQPQNTSQTINYNSKILVFFSNVQDQDNLPSELTFYYTDDDDWRRDGSSMEVINGQSYCAKNVVWSIVGNTATAKRNDAVLTSFNLNSLSDRYTASRYVDTQKQVYSNTLERYVNVYTVNNVEYYGYQTLEFESPLSVVNLVTNPSDFTKLSGWIGTDLTYDIYPVFNSNTDLTTYDPQSYITFQHTNNKNLYIANTGVTDNKSYFPDGFTKGERYIFRLQITSGNNYTKVTNPSLFVPSVALRNISASTPSPTDPEYFTLEAGSGKYADGYLEYVLKCVRSCSIEKIKNMTLKDVAIFLKPTTTSTVTYHIQEMQFFKEVYSEGVRINPGEVDLQGVSKNVWRYYLASKEESHLTADALEYDHISEEEWSSAVPVYNNCVKTATIQVSKSNRFNILQDIAERFKCWVRFEIDHNTDGSIKRDGSGLRKFVTLYQNIGNETSVNFNYGVDLKGVSRTLTSTNVATKIIVPSNENSLGENGFCSIARSPQNYTGENLIYNFDYYISQGLLSQEQLNQDLYDKYDGYFVKLHKLNQKYRKNEVVLSEKKIELTRQEATSEMYSQYLTSAQTEQANIANQAYKLSNTSTMSGVNNYLKTHANNTRVQSLVNDYTRVKKTINKYSGLLKKINKSIKALSGSISTLESVQDSITSSLNAAHAAFYKKYSRFIQEGVWSSEDYWDDTKYYFDAVSVAFDSSRPKVEYSVNVVRLSDIDEYSSKVFDLGDICTVQDIRYFGYESDGITPYKERVFISEVTSYFDTPSKDNFKVQNYKNQFDDLFQRITATTQSVSFSEGKYAKVSDIIGTDGTIKYSVIQATFDNNKNLVMGSLNESVLIDNRGITVLSNESDAGQVRITSGGLFVTNDGGLTWKNAVRGDGISADVLVAGSINTEQINICGKDAPSFVWNDKGINAYLIENGGSTDLNQYVRFDKYGIYGVKEDSGEFSPASEADVYNKASFGMTWNRFFMKKTAANKGSVEISTDDGILVKDKNGNTVFVANEDGVIIGNIGGSTGSDLSTLKSLTKVVNDVTYIDGGSIYTGSISVNKIRLSGKMIVYRGINSDEAGGWLGYMKGNDGVNSTSGIGLLSDDDNSQIIATDAGVRMTRKVGGTACSAYINSSGRFTVTSGWAYFRSIDCSGFLDCHGHLTVYGSTVKLNHNPELGTYSGETYCSDLIARGSNVQLNYSNEGGVDHYDGSTYCNNFISRGNVYLNRLADGTYSGNTICSALYAQGNAYLNYSQGTYSGVTLCAELRTIVGGKALTKLASRTITPAGASTDTTVGVVDANNAAGSMRVRLTVGTQGQGVIYFGKDSSSNVYLSYDDVVALKRLI